MSREFFERVNRFLNRYELRGSNAADNAHRWTINVILLVLGYNIFTIFKGYNDTMLSLRVVLFLSSRQLTSSRQAQNRSTKTTNEDKLLTRTKIKMPTHSLDLAEAKLLIYSNLLVSYNSRESILNMCRATFAPGAPCEPHLALRFKFSSKLLYLLLKP